MPKSDELVTSRPRDEAAIFVLITVLSKYVNNQMREISLETLNTLCSALRSQPGELIEYVRDKKR